MTDERLQEITAKIDSEGFEYYFTSYGPDEELKELCGREIGNFKDARDELIEVMREHGIEVEG